MDIFREPLFCLPQVQCLVLGMPVLPAGGDRQVKRHTTGNMSKPRGYEERVLQEPREKGGTPQAGAQGRRQLNFQQTLLWGRSASTPSTCLIMQLSRSCSCPPQRVTCRLN